MSFSPGCGLFLLTLLATSRAEDWPCDDDIYCQPERSVLHLVQTSKIFQDSKTFVDMPIITSRGDVLADYTKLGNNASREDVIKFLSTHFLPPGSETVVANLTDWGPHPEFLDRIEDSQYKGLAEVIHTRWQHLARKSFPVAYPEFSTIIELENHFIVPGGRFREVYYWDSFWTIKGLLLSELYSTTEGMLRNFKDQILAFGHIPNGNRIYYTKRSQPPLFAHMVSEYAQVVEEREPARYREVLQEFVWPLVTEMDFWLNRMENVTVGGRVYKLAKYRVEVDGPRPESYLEDFRLAQHLPPYQRREWYIHMKSGAESGWDYSSRWFSNRTNDVSPLLAVETGNILPVELNAFLCKNAQIISEMLSVLENEEYAERYRELAANLSESIRAVLWNEEDSMWYDYNYITKRQNRQMYPSNLAPVYSNCTHADFNATRFLDRVEMSGLLSHPGGVPVSLFNSTPEHQQQWDFPNVWPPMVEITVTSLELLNSSRSVALARQMANKFLNNVYRSFKDSNGKIFEKYDCQTVGRPGGGGEYDVQEGFGWTNGVFLSLVDRFPGLESNSSSRETLAAAWLLVVSFLTCLLAN